MEKIRAMCELYVLAPYFPAMKHYLLLVAYAVASHAVAEDWPQFMLNSQHSGNAADREIGAGSLGVQGAIAMTDGIYTSPVVADGKVYVVDGSGRVGCFDAATLKKIWEFQTRGGA